MLAAMKVTTSEPQGRRRKYTRRPPLGPLTSSGQRKFDQLIAERDLLQVDVCEQLEAKAPDISDVRRAYARPTVTLIARIEEWSRPFLRGGRRGAPTITAPDWLLDSERHAKAS